MVKNPTADARDARDVDLVPGSGRSGESQFLGSLIRSPGSPRRRKLSEAPEEEKTTNVWVFFFSLHCFALVNITMYLAQGHVSA